ncbi:MAG: hypothetical protein AAGD07_16695, partial [Planctomycetota bacterium]
MATEESTSEYLKLVWNLDPAAHATEILQARNQAGIAGADAFEQQARVPLAKKELAAEPVSEDMVTVDQIRRDFFDLTTEVVARHLTVLGVDANPVEMATVERLTQINASRVSLNQLLDDASLDEELRTAIRKSLLETPAQAALIQEGYLKKLISPERKRSASVSARVIRDRYPEIHLLQRDWLESILRCQ